MRLWTEPLWKVGTIWCWCECPNIMILSILFYVIWPHQSSIMFSGLVVYMEISLFCHLPFNLFQNPLYACSFPLRRVYSHPSVFSWLRPHSHHEGRQQEVLCAVLPQPGAGRWGGQEILQTTGTEPESQPPFTYLSVVHGVYKTLTTPSEYWVAHLPFPLEQPQFVRAWILQDVKSIPQGC